MKLVTLIVWSCVFASGLGCGGGSSQYDVKQASSDDPKVIRLGGRVTTTGNHDALDSVILASAGAGCSITKTRTAVGPQFDTSEGKCGEMAITFVLSKSDSVLFMECAVAVGVTACKGQFNKILGMAHDAGYIK